MTRTKLAGMGLMAFALMAGSVAVPTSGNAADPGHMRIQNASKYRMTYVVPDNDNWANCCDAPKPGFAVVDVAPNSTSEYFLFVRTDGHGCNGKQGQFGMIPSIPVGDAPQEQQFWFDSHGGLAFQGPNPNYASQLIDEGNHNYKWIVTPTQ
jgi:hypothetical protein